MITRDALLRVMAATSLERGLDYAREGRVVEVSEAGVDVLLARVRGSRGHAYHQRIALKRDTDGDVVAIDGRCSCPMLWNCKHVAAALLVAIARMPAEAPAVPHDVAAWLRQVRAVEARFRVSDGDTASKPRRERLLFVVTPEADRPFALRPMRVNIKKDGSFGRSARLYDPERLNGREPPAFTDAEDRTILARCRLLGAGPYRFNRALVDSDEELTALLDRVVAGGRGRWLDPHGAVLVPGGPRRATLAWEAADDGTQVPKLCDDVGRSLALLPLFGPRYVDPASGEVGPLALDVPGELAAAILRAPPVPARAAAEVAAALGGLAAESLPVPQVRDHVIRDDVVPVPKLTLFALEAERRSGRYGRSGRPTALGALRLAFVYDGHEVAAFPHGDVTLRAGDRVVTYRRDRAMERDAHARLDGHGAVRVDALDQLRFADAEPLDRVFADDLSGFDITLLVDEGARDPVAEDALTFVTEAVPALQAAGWQVEIAPSWPFRVHAGPVDVRAGAVAEGDGFAVGVTLEVKGQRLDLAPVVSAVIDALPLDGEGALPADFDLAAFVDEAAIWRRLDDGSHVRLDGATLAPLVAAVLRVRAAFGDFHPAEAARLAEFADALEGCGIPFTGGPEILELGRRLQRLAQAPAAAAPASLRAVLRPYQQTGYGWLTALAATGFGGVLADDMGLGKTLQTLALLVERHLEVGSDRPSLLVVPTSLLSTWAGEAARFAPELRLLIRHGRERHDQAAAIAIHHVVVTTYALLRRDHDLLAAQPWELVILDEAQAVKNPASAAARHIRTLDARMRLALTGTPVENNLEDLWALFDWLVPGLLGDRQHFRARFRQRIEKQGDAGAQLELNARIRPFVLRRRKDEVLAELPEKTEIIEPVRLGHRQRTLYETIRATMDRRVRDAIAAKGLAASRITILDALLKLRQVCCDPALLPDANQGGPVESAKRARLVEMLDELLAEGRRVLVFSQFTAMLDLIEADVRARRWRYVKLTGRTEDRAAVVDDFQAGRAPLFLISLKAGGVGLTLTAADTVILYDPWWNPAVERQAMDRAHRIGQTQPVFVYKLVVEGAVEAAIVELQAKKQRLADALFEGPGDGPLALTEDDLARLFGPSDGAAAGADR